MGVHRAEQSAEIEAPAEACFAAIVDYETFPEWQEAVEAVEVLERDPDGPGAVVRFEVDAKLRRISYTLRYHHERPTRVWWEFIEGDGVELIEGEYVFEPVARGQRTRAVYRVGIDPGVPLPGLLARRLNQGVMRRSVADLKREVERRVAAA